jgi:hypothetical protein
VKNGNDTEALLLDSDKPSLAFMPIKVPNALTLNNLRAEIGNEAGPGFAWLGGVSKCFPDLESLGNTHLDSHILPSAGLNGEKT